MTNHKVVHKPKTRKSVLTHVQYKNNQNGKEHLPSIIMVLKHNTLMTTDLMFKLVD